jgi:hypothetical protein
MVFLSETQRNRRTLRGIGLSQCQQPFDLVSGPAPADSAGIREGHSTVGEADPLGCAGPERQDRRPERPMRKVHSTVPPRSQLASQPGEAAKATGSSVLVIGDHLGRRGVMLEQNRSRWGGDHIDGAVPRGEGRQQRGREHDITEEGGLDDEGGSLVRRDGGMLEPVVPGWLATAVPPFRRSAVH